MAQESSTTVLAATRREPSGSRAARRLRREGTVPGIVYGGGEEPVSFSVNGRELRHTLASAGAVLDLQLDGATGTPVVVKELIRHPVTGEMTHVDLLRVRLDQAIQAQVTVELVNAEDAAGVKLGGILEHSLREVTVEALPTAIPDSIQHDIIDLGIGETLTLGSIVAPEGVTIIGDGDTLIASISAPRLKAEDETEIETETEVVGEGEPAAAGDAGEAEASGDDSAE
jgi:large subunit ribosomal protein L25